MELFLWEILVPTTMNNGKPIRTRFHRVWDAKVQKIAGGLTVLQPVKGKWVSINHDLFVEKMIPVRIACTIEQIDKIAEMTLEYYSQHAIMYYRVADKVVIKESNRETLSVD